MVASVDFVAAAELWSYSKDSTVDNIELFQNINTSWCNGTVAYRYPFESAISISKGS